MENVMTEDNETDNPNKLPIYAFGNSEAGAWLVDHFNAQEDKTLNRFAAKVVCKFCFGMRLLDGLGNFEVWQQTSLGWLAFCRAQAENIPKYSPKVKSRIHSVLNGFWRDSYRDNAWKKGKKKSFTASAKKKPA
jgi:hypothetical protein